MIKLKIELLFLKKETFFHYVKVDRRNPFVLSTKQLKPATNNLS